MVDEKRQLISCMLDIGKEMIKSGAEISRVEDTLIRIGLSYGAKRVNAFALASILPTEPLQVGIYAYTLFP